MEIKQLIKECVHDIMEREAVKHIIREELNRMLREGMFEVKDEPSEKDDKESKGVTDTARAELNNILDKNPLIKKSQIAYKLMPGVDHDSARHIFNDMLDGDDPMSTKEANTAIDMIHNAGI